VHFTQFMAYHMSSCGVVLSDASLQMKKTEKTSDLVSVVSVLQPKSSTVAVPHIGIQEIGLKIVFC